MGGILMKRFLACAIAFTSFALELTAAAQEKSTADQDKATKTAENKGIHFDVSGGAIVGRVADVSAYGEQVSVGFDFVARKSVAVQAQAFFVDAHTVGDLGMVWGGFRGDAIWTPVDRFNFGIGADAFYFNLNRVTNSSSVSHPAVGAFGHVGFDVIRFDGGQKLEIAALPEADWLFGAPVLSTAFVADIRF
jgi:hypothetical protein